MKYSVQARIEKRNHSKKFSFLRKPSFKLFKFSKRIIFFLFLFVFILLVVVGLYKIKIKEIVCESQYGPCSSEILAKLKFLEGENYFQSKAGIEKLLRSEFFVKSYSTKIDLPSTIMVFLIERKAEVAFAKTHNINEFYLVDSEGFIINKQEKTSLPAIVLETDFDFQIGKSLSNDMFFATFLMRDLVKIYNIKLGYLNNDSLEVEVNDGIKVLFPLSGERDLLFGSLGLILSRLNTGSKDLKIEDVLGKKTTVIDLRFKNPVIK